MRLTSKVLLTLLITTIVRCNTQKPEDKIKQTVNKTNTDTDRLKEKRPPAVVTDNLKIEHLTSILGAFSITKTVLGHYQLLKNDTDDETQLLKLMIGLCKERSIDSQLIRGLQRVHADLIAYQKDKGETLTLDKYDSTKKNCEEYVQMVFVSFPCFRKGGDGRYYYHSNSDK